MAANVEAIQATHSIGIEARETFGGKPTVEWLVRAGDRLPRKGTRTFKAGESLNADSAGSLNFRVLEGESGDPEYNRLIGLLKIAGKDFDDGEIFAGAELRCGYEMHDSGWIVLEVAVPCLGATFHVRHNCYSRQEGQIAFDTEGARVREYGNGMLRGLGQIIERVREPMLEKARSLLERAAALDPERSEPECVQKAVSAVAEARSIVAEVRKRNLHAIRQIELDRVSGLFIDHIREFAQPSEEATFDNLVRSAQRAIHHNSEDFERHVNDLRITCLEILERQAWFVVEEFKAMASSPHWFADQGQFDALVSRGRALLRNGDIDSLRLVIGRLARIQFDQLSDTDSMEVANIIPV